MKSSRLYTLIKKKRKFSSYTRDRVQSHSYMTNDLLTYGENICAFPHILGSPSSYMTLHPIPCEFPYTWGKCCFLFYQCSSGHLQYSTVVYGKNICAFRHILGSSSSYMTLRPIPSYFPYTWGKFSFLFYQCSSGHLQYSTVVYVFLSFYVLHREGPKAHSLLRNSDSKN
jgi:hypothetical protein